MLTIVSLALLMSAPAESRRWQVVVEAGTLDRQHAPLTFMAPLPADPQRTYALTDRRGKPVPMQVDELGKVSMVLGSLRAGSRALFTLQERASGRTPAGRGVVAQRRADDVSFLVGGKHALSYKGNTERPPRPDIPTEFLRGGYLHPVLTPAGALVTDDYPANHLHHHGIWTSYAVTAFEGRKPDFWNMGAKTGRILSEAVGPVWQGPVAGGLRAWHLYVDLLAPAPKTALREEWRLTVWRTHPGPSPYYLFDLEVSQQAIGGAPLTLGEHRYGGLGVRGHGRWDGADKTVFLTSEGRSRADGNGTKARWCYVGGKVGAKLAGIAILGHPANPRAPEPMRIHPDEPFFSFAPMQAGAIVITPGAPLHMHYRFVVTDGVGDAALFERLWKEWSQPARVTVTPLERRQPTL